MKKFYLLLTVGLLGLSAIIISNYIRPTEKEFSSDNFTPEEFWQKQYQEKKAKRKVGYSKANKPDMYSKYFKDITTRIGESESAYKMNYKTLELQKARENGPRLKSTKASLDFVQRGPANVGGRTRAIVVDPDVSDKNTWFTGSASGGIWKTTDGAESWINLSSDLTNLSVNALKMAPSDHNILYAGTGESFPGGTHMIGNGIWKSEDHGDSWIQMASTATDDKFSSVNRLWVNPINADIVIAATEYGIFKTTDGGTVWAQVYESDPKINGVEVLAAYPDEENIIYAGENSKGVLRTLDGGNTWKLASNGLAAGGRYEIAVSPVNKDVVFASINVSDKESYVCISKNSATDWHLYEDGDDNADNENFLGGQGGYDNAITAHPFNENEVFVAGVNMWKIAFNETATEKEAVKDAYTENTDFLSFIGFGGSHLGGGLSTAKGTGLVATDWTSVEILFGKGLSQKAHRFTVPDKATSGVAASDYTYVDYVEVPFQVWDTKNNRQLMVSFRDQEKDGAFNLYTRTSDDYGDLGREYIYVNAVEYNSDAADAGIAVSGGHIHKAMYMIWPTLTSGATWDDENLPTSKIVVEHGTLEVFGGTTTSVADAYGEYGGGNNYDQGAGFGKTKIPGVHPDHHNITIIPLEDGNFRVINGNDGGIGVSEDNGVTFNQKANNYITTQFYGVAKNPEANEYIGGMQDNGTWQSAASENASSKTNYYFRLGGDGFECLWHGTDSKKLLGSIYYNAIYRTSNGGQSWSGVKGIAKDDGPFITHLSASKMHPDVVFAVGNIGVYKSTDFGSNWTLKNIESNWSNGTAYSVHNVEVSLSDPKIVWAGASNSGSFNMHVSQDEGETYTEVNEYAERNMNAYISGIATHPTEPNTAYLLFSTGKAPKIIRTTDLGQNWEDISGFGTNTKSNNGFPDVVTQCLLVMPHSPKTIWAGTEIGMFESIDNGESWHVLSGNLPPVSIYDMHLVGDQVVIATHGRGVWSVNIPDINSIPVVSEFKEIKDHVIKLDVDVKAAYDYMEIYINDKLNETIQTPALGSFSHELTIEEAGEYNSYVIAYIGQNQMKSNLGELVVKDKMPIVNGFEIIKYYKLNLQLEIPVEYDKFEIYINDEVYNTYNNPAVGSANYDITVEETGIYSAYIIGYMFDSSFKSNSKDVEIIPTGIETIEEEINEMTIYPNPCRGVFKLQLGNSTQDFTLEIFDLSGKKVYSQKDKNTVDNTIRIESLKTGFYIVRVTMDGKVMSSKIQVIK
ncbi:T9SS type A sorting domain-containing protein [Ancylomarina sp. YFZ004]